MDISLFKMMDVMSAQILDKQFSEALGTSLERVMPGDILVVRSLRRDKTSQLPGGLTLMTPVWILFSGGRGIVSTSRFLQQIVSSWAESFAAPEHLLIPSNQQELLDAVGHALDAQVAVNRQRIFVSNDPDASSFAPHAGHSREIREDLENMPAVFREDADREQIRRILSSGAVEYGRLIRLVVIR